MKVWLLGTAGEWLIITSFEKDLGQLLLRQSKSKMRIYT
jgi:hypothetical protein